MQQYLLGEKTFSEAQLRNKAIENNMSLEDLLEMNPDIKLKEDLSNNVFTLGDKEFSHDQLNKKAKDNNMTLQQLLDINPDIKKAPSKTDGSSGQPESSVVKDIDTSPTGLFFHVLQETNPGVGKALAVLSDFGANLLRTADQIGEFGETMAEIKAGEIGGISGSGIAPYIAKRVAAQQAGVTLEEFDETNPYNIIKLEGLANIFDKATIKYKDPETGQIEDYISLFEKGEYDKATEAFVYETAGALPSLLISRFPLGYAMLGGSSFADKLNTDLFERPDQTAEKILTNALIYGGSDAVGEYFGGRYLNKLSGLVKGGGKAGLDRVKDVMIGGIGAFIKTAWKGGKTEFMQEAITSVIQTGGDDLIYGDEKTGAEYFRKALHSGLIGFALGGGSGSVSLGMNKANKTKFYEYIAPKTYKKKQVKLSGLQEEAESDLKNAPNDKKDFFQKRVDDIKKKKEDLKNELYQSFENATESQLEYHLDNLQIKHDQLDIITSGDKYSKTAKDDAKKKFLEAANNNESLFAATDIDYQAIDDLDEGITARTAEKLRERRNNLWFKAKDLDIEFIDTQEKFEKLIEEKGAAVALATDGFAEIVEDGKTKIVINQTVAASAEAANVIGHELLHYAISHRFANDPKGMRESIVSFKDYIKQLNGGDYILKSLEKSFINGDYALLDKNGNVQYDSDGLVVMKREQDVEEYFNKFSDLIDSEAIKSVEKVSSGLLNSFRTMSRGLGVGIRNVDFKNGQQIFELLVDYNKNINRKGLLGAITQRKAIKSVAGEKTVTKKDQITKKDKVTKASRSTVNLDIGEGDLSQRIDILTKGAKTQSEFQQPGGAFDNIYSGMLEGKFDRIFGEGISPGQRVIQRQNLADRLINYDPAKTPELSKWLYGGSGKAGNVVYAGLVAKKKLFEAGEKTKREVRIDTEEAKQLEDKPTKTKKTFKIEPKARKLTSLADIDIDRHPLIKEATKVELKRLIESNPKNLTEEIQKVLIPDLVEIIRQEMGVIGEKAGELNIPESYKAYLADSYTKTISSMEILKIRTNYKNLFKKEKMGFADYKTEKSNKPSLKKDSNYRKDIFKNITNKALFTKYHTEGKKNKLIANQRNLALMRAEAEAVRASENYIIENSENLNEVYAAELRNFIDSKTVQKQKQENKSFDSVKFSKSIALAAFEIRDAVLTAKNVFDNNGNLVGPYKNILKNKKDSKAVGDFVWANLHLLSPETDFKFLRKAYEKLYNDDRGTAYETNLIEVSKIAEKIYGIDALEVVLRKPTEKDALPDMILKIHGVTMNIEAKMALAQYSSVTNSIVNDLMTISKQYSPEFMKILTELQKESQKGIEKAKKFLKENGIEWDGIKLLSTEGHNMLKNNYDIGTRKSFFNGISATLPLPLKFISEIYTNKKHPVYLMQLMGRGLFSMGGDTFNLGIPALEDGGDGFITLRVGSNSQYRVVTQADVNAKRVTSIYTDGTNTKKKGEKKTKRQIKTGMKSYSYRSIPGISDKVLNDMKSSHNIEHLAGMMKLMDSKEVANIKVQNEAKKKQTLNNAIKKSQSAKNPSKGITVLDFDDTLATTKSLVKFTTPDGTKGALNAEEYASTYQDLLAQGYKFDFTEFDKVVKAKLAPLFNKALKLQKKFGPENMFILTARPPAAQKAIRDFLKANGLNIPLKNISALGNSTAEAKALWISEKVGEGYNDFYFADDALQNVKAVKNMLDQFDVKSKVQQAKSDFVHGDPQVVRSIEEASKNDIKDVGGLANPGTYSNIKFSKSHRTEYEKTITKHRPDLVKNRLVSQTVDNMFVFIDGLNIPSNKKRKYEQITTKWLATSNIKLKEDAYKLEQAVEIAEKYKEDIFSYRNPNELIEKYAGKIKKKPLDPSKTKEFTFSGEHKKRYHCL